MNRFEDNFILWFLILSLIFTGVVIEKLFGGMSTPALISLLSNFATILGFILAIKAYWHWRHQDTQSEQAKIIREILMLCAELELNLEMTFDSAINDELKKNKTIYPSVDQRVKLTKVKSLTEDINILMVKYYAIEPNPANYLLNNSKSALLSICYENEPFEVLKQYLYKIGCLLRYTKGENTLSCENGYISSSLQSEAGWNVSSMFEGADSYVQLSLFFADKLRLVENDLRPRIK